MSKGNVILLNLPSIATGDFWHNAAAAILFSGYSSRKDGTQLVSVFGVDSKHTRFEGSLARMPKTYDYLVTCQVPTLLIKLESEADHPLATPEDEAAIWRAVEQITRKQYADILLWEKLAETAFFLERWSYLDVTRPGAVDSQHDNASLSAIHTPALHHFLATTIAMQYLHMGLPKETRMARVRLLGQRLGGYHQSPLASEVDAAGKIRELAALIQNIRRKEGMAGARVVLFNDRRGEANKSQDSLAEHFEQVKRSARAHGMLTLRVATGVPKDEIGDDDLDIFDARTDAPFRDKLFISRFWRLIGEMDDDVFGLVGGRSASVDVAAFVGVNCLEWDEPTFHIAAHARSSGQLGDDPHGAEYLGYNVPQFLRLLNQSSIMSVGLLDRESYDRERKCYTRLEESYLQRWLSKEADVYPLLPTNKEAQSIFNNELKIHLEHVDLRIFAVNLHTIWRQSRLCAGISGRI